MASRTLGGHGCGASVMDYPPPLLQLGEGGTLHMNASYAAGIGEFDKISIRYAYTVFMNDDELPLLREVLRHASRTMGFLFLTDQDNAGASGVDWRASQWDGDTASALHLRAHSEPPPYGPGPSLHYALQVRAIALQHLGTAAQNGTALTVGTATAELRALFAPLYLFHRYEVASALKAIGGLEFQHASSWANEAPPPPAPSSPALQRAALWALLDAVSAETLAIPEPLTAALGPPAFGWGQGDPSEILQGRTGPFAFDPLGAAELAASLVFDGLLEPARAARLHLQALGGTPGGTLSLDELLANTTQKVISCNAGAIGKLDLGTTLELTAARVYADRLIRLKHAAPSRLAATLHRALAAAASAAHGCASHPGAMDDVTLGEWLSLATLLDDGQPFMPFETWAGQAPLQVPRGPPI
jgi:hypothetical protein